jgi:hypothetical protein
MGYCFKNLILKFAKDFAFINYQSDIFEYSLPIKENGGRVDLPENSIEAGSTALS